MPALALEQVPGLLSTGASTRVETDAAPRFRPGDAVVAKMMNPARHTRLPRYVRGKRGVVEADHGVFVFNDTNAYGTPKPQHVYSVRFNARDLWGPDANPRDSLRIDMFDDYLDPAGA